MNKRTTLFMILSLIVHTPIFANNYYLGTYSPYDTMNIYYPPIPEDLHIRFIEHLGRHGSRYPTSGKEINFLVQILETQHNDQNLSFQGETLLKQLQLLYHQCENKWGECTALAIDQQRGIAERLMKEVGMEVFQNIVVICDPKQRCTSSYQ